MIDKYKQLVKELYIELKDEEILWSFSEPDPYYTTQQFKNKLKYIYIYISYLKYYKLYT